MSQKNISIVRELYDAVARRDFDRMPIDAQIEWVEADVPDLWFRGTHHGRQTVLQEVIEPAMSKFEDFRVETDEFLEAGDRVVVTGRFHGREKDTGNELHAPFAHICTLRGDKITRFQSYTDTANWLQAMYHVHVERPVGAAH